MERGLIVVKGEARFGRGAGYMLMIHLSILNTEDKPLFSYAEVSSQDFTKIIEVIIKNKLK